MSPATFARWLRAQAKRHDPTGDLARDAMDDVRAGCLWRITTPEALGQHITRDHFPDPAALDAIAAAEHEWRNAR